MADKNSAIIKIGKGLAIIPLSALAAGGSATSIPWLAAILAIPVAALGAYDTIAPLIAKLKSQQDEVDELLLPIPNWWDSDQHYWQNLCNEISEYFPSILQDMAERMQQQDGVITMEIVQRLLADSLENTLTTQYFKWDPGQSKKTRAAEYVAPLLLQKLDQVLTQLKPLIERQQQETALKDTHTTASNTGRTADNTERTAKNTEEIVKYFKEQHDASKTHPLSDQEIATLREQYCYALSEQWKMLDFKGIMHVEMNRPFSIPLLEVTAQEGGCHRC